MLSQEIGKTLSEGAALISRRLKKLVEERRGIPARLRDAVLHSLMAGGKRLRPVVCLQAAALCGAGPEKSLIPACALEMVHTYSLIHDDLPAMDDDDLRRGRPSCHKAFDEATAILAGDALLTLAFEVITSEEGLSPKVRIELADELAFASGPEGMVAGQMLDLQHEGTAQPSENVLMDIHRLKTMHLIRAAARMGVISAEGDRCNLDALTLWAEKAGLAFQIADDVLDEVSTAEELGKTPGKDREEGKVTAVAIWGSEDAGKRARELAREAASVVEAVPGAGFFAALVHYFVQRLN